MNTSEMFRNLIHLAAADGKFTVEEISFLAQRAEQWNIPDGEFQAIIDGLGEDPHVELQIPEGHRDRIRLLKDMIRLMAVDGELADIEKRLCALASSQMEFNVFQFDEILKEVISEIQPG